MENKNSKSIVLIALAVFSIVMILANGNIEKAYALTLTSNEPDGTMATVSAHGYNSAHDYLLTAEITGGVFVVHIVDGETLTQVGEVITTITTGFLDDIKCTASICFFAGQDGSDPVIAKISMSSFTLTTYSEPQYVSCAPTNYVSFGSTIYITMADFGGCPYTGAYSIPISFTSDVGAGNVQYVSYDDSTVFGDSDDISGSCLVEGRYWFTGEQNSDTIRRYDLSTQTLTASATLGANVDDIACSSNAQFATDSVYAVSVAGDWVKAVDMSSMAVNAGSASITNPQSLMVRGDTVYVSRDDASTVTVYDKNDLTTGAFTLFSSLAHNDVLFFKGNSTRFNMVAPTTNDNIYYAVNGIIDEEEEEEPPEDSGSANGVCLNIDVNGDGRVNVLDCAGSNTAFAGFTSGQNVSTIIGRITDGLGLTDTESNPDIETNGVGLFMFLGLLILTEFFILAGYLGFTSKTNTERSMADIALVVLIGAFTDLAIAFYLNWLPDIAFYTVIVLVAGFLTFGILGKMRGR